MHEKALGGNSAITKASKSSQHPHLDKAACVGAHNYLAPMIFFFLAFFLSSFLLLFSLFTLKNTPSKQKNNIFLLLYWGIWFSHICFCCMTFILLPFVNFKFVFDFILDWNVIYSSDLIFLLILGFFHDFFCKMFGYLQFHTSINECYPPLFFI